MILCSALTGKLYVFVAFRLRFCSVCSRICAVANAGHIRVIHQCAWSASITVMSCLASPASDFTPVPSSLPTAVHLAERACIETPDGHLPHTYGDVEGEAGPS